ncbi:MAG: hypothetical protein EBZ67_11210 [Chitinophagia bacterium]|nr:hypothetical protein [Chitinophagia bacterium]
MRTYQPIRNLLLPMLVIAMVAGCQKPDAVTIPPVQSHFTFKDGGTYEVLTANSRFAVPVGITTTQTTPTVVEFTITSPTGAVAGTHYTVAGNSITIPAGQAIGSINILGSLAAYSSGRRDTLVITLATKAGGVSPIITNTTYRLALRGPCFEGDVTLSAFLGSYKNTNEDFGGPYGPYTTTISAVRQLTPTTGEITVTNIFDYGWNPIKFVLDWTNPAARTAIPPQQSGIGNAGTISSTYAGRDISVRPLAGQPGTFSICKQTLNLTMQLGVTGLGFFGTPYYVNMAR